MRLYSFRHSPNPLKVRLALAELEVAYECIEVDLFKGEHRSEQFRKVSPHQRVPVWQEEGLTLRESNGILMHLGRTRHSDLWPFETRWEAMATQWLFFESFSLAVHCGHVWWTDVVARTVNRPGASDAVLDDSMEELERSLGLLDEHLSTRKYMLGESMSLVDCSLGVAVAMLRNTRLDQSSRWPNVTSYRDRIRSRPSWTTAQGELIHELG